MKRHQGIATPLILTDFEFGSEMPAYHRIKSILSEPDAPTALFGGVILSYLRFIELRMNWDLVSLRIFR